MENKTHYRKVFKSDHLGVADLEDFIEEKKRLVFTVKHVTQHLLIPGDKKSGVVVAGRRVSANIAHFVENIKPLVLNAGNSKIMKGFCNGSSFVEDWKNVVIELYVQDGVTFGKEITSGVRIKPNQPTLSKPELLPTNKKVWDHAITYLKGEGTVTGIKQKWSLSTANEQKLKDASI